MNTNNPATPKQQTIEYLQELGISKINQMADGSGQLPIKRAQDIAKRILITSYVCFLAEDESDKPELVAYFQKENLWNDVTEEEKELFTRVAPLTDDEKAALTQKAECIWVLLWAIYLVDFIELPTHEVHIRSILDVLPEFLRPTHDFVHKAVLRTTDEIIEQSDLITKIHWAAANKDREHLLEDIAYQRYIAMEWITGNMDWKVL